MSNILKGIQLNEVDPRNFDSDIDYYNALNKPPRRGRSEDDYVEPHDEPIKFKQDPNARPQYSISKDENRQAGYNMTLTVKAPTTQKAQWAAESYVDSEWGAKKQVGKITPVADGVVQVHMIDNHKYGMWKPWKDEDPIAKPISFNEEQLDELSPETLASYKKKAGAQASELDKQAWAGQQPTQQRIEKANKRYSGIIRATKKELDNDVKGIKENAEELNMGDPVVVTGDVQFNGATGDIVGFSNDKHFVIVDLYNHGKRSFHSSDVSFNDYADSDDEHEHINRVAEDEEKTPDTDAILEYLTKAARTMQDHKDSFSPEGWDRIKRSYNFMRSYLKDGDYEGFLSAYNESLRSHPDSTGLLIDEMFVAAGLDENATIEDFFAKVSEIKEGKVKDALIKGTYGKPADEPKTRSSGMFSGILNARNAIEKSKQSQRPNYNKTCDMCNRAGDSCVCEDMPPPENARKTQIAGTLPTYKKAADILNKTGVQGKALDFGAGLGMGTAELGKDAHSYEPFPNEKFKPHFVDVTKIPDNSYHKIVNLNVLNVVPNTGEHKIRDSIVKNIGRVLAPGGVALITTRGKDVLTIKGTPGEEPTSMISKIGTYQKGFTQKELLQYIQQTLGKGFEVSSIKLGPAGVMIKKLDQEGVTEAKTQKKEVVGFTSESEFKTWKQYAQKEGYEIREAGNLPGSYAAFDDDGKRVGYFYNKFDLPNGYYHIGELITSVENVAEGDDRGDYYSIARAANQASRTAKSKQDHAKAADLHDRAATYGLSSGQDQSVIHDHQMTAWEHNRASKKMKEDVTEGDNQFNRMMNKITSPKALDTREALAMMDDLIYQGGASYKEALDQASMSYEIDPATLNSAYQEHSQTTGSENIEENAYLEETYHGDEFYEAYGDLWYDEENLNEAEYRGRKVPLGKPMRGDVKKFKVYVKDPSTGNIKKVNFGDPNMRIKKSIPGRRKSFRARHHCENPGPRTKARYWSCRQW